MVIPWLLNPPKRLACTSPASSRTRLDHQLLYRRFYCFVYVVILTILPIFETVHPADPTDGNELGLGHEDDPATARGRDKHEKHISILFACYFHLSQSTYTYK